MDKATFVFPKAEQLGYVAELADAVRGRGMKFAGSHHRMYCFYDPRYEGLFGHPDYDGPVDPWEKEGEGPGEAFVEEWLATVETMFEHHEPDLLTEGEPIPLEWRVEGATLDVVLPDEPPAGTHEAACGIRSGSPLGAPTRWSAPTGS